MEDNLVLLISVVAGFVGMPIINLLKGLLQIDDFKAVALTTGVSILLGAVVVYLNGGFALAEITVDAVAAAAGLVFASATIFFKALASARGQ